MGKTPTYEELEQRVKVFEKEAADSIRAAEGIDRSEEKYKSLLDLSPDPIVILQDNKCKFINIAFTNVFGYSKESVSQGLSFFKLVQDQDENEVLKQYERRMEGKPVPKNYCIDFVAKNGTLIPCETSVSLIAFDGQPADIMIIRDITERMQAEEKILQAKIEWERTFDAAPDLIAVMDDKHRIVKCNKAMADSLGVTSEEAVGLTCYEHVHGTTEPPSYCPHTRLLENHQTHSTEVCEEQLGGTFKVTVSPIFDDSECLKGAIHIARNITARKWAEEELKKSEDKFRSLVETISDFIWEMDQDGVYTYASPQVNNLLGYEPEEVVGKSVFDFFLQDEFETVTELNKSTIESRKPIVMVEAVSVHKDGHLVVLESNGTPIFSENGDFQGYRGVDRDITAKKKMEEELRISNDNFFSIFRSNPNAIAITTLDDRRIFDANEMFFHLSEYNREEVIGHTVTELDLWASEEDNERFKTLLRENGEVKNFEFIFNRKVSSPGKGLLSASLLTLGDETCLIGILNDISERKRAEEELSNSEKRYRLLAENVTDIIWTMDMGMNFTYFSPSITRVQGYSVEEAVARTIEESLTPKSYKIAMKVFEEELEMHQKGERDPERSVMLELELPCKDGSTILAELITKFYYDSEGEPLGVIGVTRDITEKKLLQAEAIRASHLAALGELAAGVAHEINNPINGVINYAEILKDESHERGERSDIPDRIIKEGERIAKIVRGLLSFSQDGKELYGPAHIKDILSDTLSLVDQHILNEGITLSVNGFSDLPSIGARYQEIQQVFLNILSNARYALNNKFSRAHKDKIIEIKGEEIKIESRDYVRTTFYDCGSGISEEIQGKICDPFFSSKPNDKGTGLGLSISHGIIKKHGGRLLFESAEGLYTKVFVDLPVWKNGQN